MSNKYTNCICPRITPWGETQNIHPQGPGLYFVSTAGHGGLYMSRERLAHFQTLFPKFDGYAGLPWLEEDVDCVLGTLAFPEDFSPEAIFYAVEAVATYGAPDFYFSQPREWLLSPAGDSLRKIAADYSASRVGYWRRGGCGSTKLGWQTFWSRGNERAITETKDYVSDTWWTDGQVQANLQKPTPTSAPKPQSLVPHFNENDCSGVYDGRCVTSDADPGL